uniref:Uncharacterized protein TCIL3000_11_13730 n=1 Tax=Trypanosoma congolense (strain IL3000) TaxID=1068625 RepID=G0V2J5_TRYCI|nr:unnamed protein product [Trypanosoma congolense IL3000]
MLTGVSLPQQRVQVVVRGRRFESTVEILSDSCVLFRSFFNLVEASLKLAETEVGSTPNHDTVDCQSAYAIAANETVDKCCKAAGAANDGGLGEDAAVELSEVGWDAKGNMWRFVYTDKRLAPEDVGVVFVYVRKMFRWRSGGGNGHQQQPEFPVRWSEMPYDAQLSMSRVVCTFGVEPLFERHCRPSAIRSDTETACALDPSGTSGPEVGKDDRNGGTVDRYATPWEKAESYLRHRMAQERSCGETETEGVRSAHRSVVDEDLVLESKGCSKCGVMGHKDDECPY